MEQAGFPVSRVIGVFHFSQLLGPGGNRNAAEVAYRRLLDIIPDHKAALEGLLFLLQIQGRGEEALEFRRRLLALHVQNLGVPAGGQGESVDYLLGGEGWMSPPDKAPRAYIQGLFDQYSADFDAHVAGRLNYQTPDFIFQRFGGVSGGRPGSTTNEFPEDQAGVDKRRKRFQIAVQLNCQELRDGPRHPALLQKLGDIHGIGQERFLLVVCAPAEDRWKPLLRFFSAPYRLQTSLSRGACQSDVIRCFAPITAPYRRLCP